jgi:hypothetical protein
MSSDCGQEIDSMKPLWIVLGIILQIAGIAIGILYFEDTWLVLLPMGTLIAIGSMLILFGVTLGGKPKPQAAPKPAAAPVVTNQPTTTVQAAPAQAAAVTATSSDPTEQLKKLAELHKSGVLTDEEYAAAKKKVLDI